MKFIVCYLLILTCFKEDIIQVSANDAEKVLRQKVSLIASSLEEKDGIFKQRLTYSGITDTMGHFYALAAKYAASPEAQKAYVSILANSINLPGFEKLTDLDEEAFFHTDRHHFYLLIFRKSNQLVTLKINRVSNSVSITELRKLADKVERGL